MKNIFLNSTEGRPRAFWRILLQLIILFLIVVLPVIGVTTAADWYLKSGKNYFSAIMFDKMMDIGVGVMLTCLVLVSLYLSGRFIEKRRFIDFGFQIDKKWWKQYVKGICLGVSLMVVIYIIELFSGLIYVKGYWHLEEVSLSLEFAIFYTIIKDFCVSIYEEAISRGYLLTNVKEGIIGLGGLNEKQAVLLAMLISSIFFGALHFQNPNATFISIINLIVNGGMFATAYILTGQLGMSMGLHCSWNLAQGLIFGFPVSGDADAISMIHIRQQGPDWITGGAFGPEGGILGLGASILGIIVLLIMERKSNILSRPPAPK